MGLGAIKSGGFELEVPKEREREIPRVSFLRPVHLSFQDKIFSFTWNLPLGWTGLPVSLRNPPVSAFSMVGL